MLRPRATSQASAGGRRGARRGVSLAELVVVLALLGIAAAAVGRVGVGQQAHYRDFAGRMHARSILRDGSALLAAELRGISPAAGDLYPGEMRDASLAFRSTLAAFVLCEAVVPGARAIDVIAIGASDTLSVDAPSHVSPSTGDSLWLYDSGPAITGADDRWVPFLVTAVAGVRRTCTSQVPAAEYDAFRLTLSAGVDAATEPHAPVRLFRRVRYALYSGADGLWYLGFTDCRPVVRDPPCAPLQPVAGPYAPYSTANGGARSGLLLRYLDREGRPTADASTVALIEVNLRSRPTEAGRFARDGVERQTIALRNALR